MALDVAFFWLFFVLPEPEAAAAICATDSFGAHRSSSFDKILVVVVVVVVVFSYRRRPSPPSPRGGGGGGADDVDAEVDAKARTTIAQHSRLCDDDDDDVVT